MNLEDTQLVDTAAKVEDWVRYTWNHNMYEVLCMVKKLNKQKNINQSDNFYHIHPNIFLKAFPHKNNPHRLHPHCSLLFIKEHSN